VKARGMIGEDASGAPRSVDPLPPSSGGSDLKIRGAPALRTLARDIAADMEMYSETDFRFRVNTIEDRLATFFTKGPRS